MKIASYSNRTGGFVSSNIGIIQDCYTDAKVKHSCNVSGFAFENTGEIEHSIAKSRTYGKENVAGFCFRNKGSIKESGWLLKEGESRTPSYSDAALAVEYKNVLDVVAKLKLGNAWKTPGSESGPLELNEGGNMYSFAEEAKENSIVKIGNAAELAAVAERIANGDTDAAKAYYLLTADINLHGQKWLPIGLTDTTPFTGIFDGGGHRIINFRIQGKGLDFAGFFGYVKGGRIANLRLDCVVNAAGANIAGALCAVNDRGVIINCGIVGKVSAEKTCGGFVGKNAGVIAKCFFAGAVSRPIAPIVFFLPFTAALVLLLSIGIGIAVSRFAAPPWSPELIDPNARPQVDSGPSTPPPAGSNRISFEMNQEVYVHSVTQVGQIDYVNPNRSTQDVVIRVLVSDAELLRVIGKTGRSAAEQAALEAEEGYDADTSYQELYRSGRIPVGYGIEDMKLSALPDGTTLPAGDYEMIVAIDAYDPETHEKAVVNAQAPITVHIVEPE